MRSVTRTWRPPFPLDLLKVLAPLRRGNGDPTLRDDVSGALWRAVTTGDGSATLRLTKSSDVVEAQAWGDGAEAALEGVPDLLGASDDDSGSVATHDAVQRGPRGSRGLRPG